MGIQVKKLTNNEFRKMGIQYWPIWEREESTFEYYYDAQEEFYIIEGDVEIKTKDSEYQISSGDFVVCPKGIECRWEVKTPVKKHYYFRPD
jgi:hypothetical protein